MWLQKQARLVVQEPPCLITHGKFNSWNILRLEDINENVSGYGNHNKAYIVRYKQLQ